MILFTDETLYKQEAKKQKLSLKSQGHRCG